MPASPWFWILSSTTFIHACQLNPYRTAHLHACRSAAAELGRILLYECMREFLPTIEQVRAAAPPTACTPPAQLLWTDPYLKRVRHASI